MNEHEWHIYLCLIEVAASVSDIQLPLRSLSTDSPGSDSCFPIPMFSSLPSLFTALHTLPWEDL